MIRVLTTTQLADQAAEKEMLLGRIAELQAEVDRLSEHQPAGPLGDIYFYQCGKCQKEKQIDISPGRVYENHLMQKAEDDHRAWLHSLSSPEADRARAMQLGEAREAAEERAHQRAKELKAEEARDWAALVQTMHDGPWGNQNDNDSGGQAVPSSTGWGD